MFSKFAWAIGEIIVDLIALGVFLFAIAMLAGYWTGVLV